MGLKLNPITGKFDLVSKENFSYETIATGKTVTVPTNQQMLVYEELIVDGTLVLNGEVVVFDLEPLSRIVATSTTESINIDLFETVRQTASGITTSLSNVSTGSKITITNRSGANNTLNMTVQGVTSPTIKDAESYSLLYNGTDYDLI